ncbi:hypothetical protein Q9Y06_002757 [Vibrio parahaemolyticus]|nr:hypothetical protein [Vibrio parahaemolyticus]
MWSKIQMWALKKAFGKVAPSRISMSGPECEKNNFYSTRIKLDGVSALVRELDMNKVKVLKYNPATGTCDIELDIDIANINVNTVEITHYLHHYYTTYTGINSFILHCLTKKDYIKVKSKRILNKVSQSLFNRKKLQLKPRYDLLDYLIENYGISRKEFSLTSLVSDMYSLRFFRHPDKENCQNKLRMYVDSFVESGEVSKVKGGGYKVNGKAIVTLEKYQTEERRHKDSVILQYSMVILTFLLAILASIQAGLIKLKPFLDLTQ